MSEDTKRPEIDVNEALDPTRPLSDYERARLDELLEPVALYRDLEKFPVAQTDESHPELAEACAAIVAEFNSDTKAHAARCACDACQAFKAAARKALRKGKR